MKKSELKRKLIEEGFPRNMYSLDGGLPNEAYCLAEEKRFWEVYYSERGIKSGLRRFKTEEQACDTFYELIRDAYEHHYGDCQNGSS
jgi:hypothetical protein